MKKKFLHYLSMEDLSFEEAINDLEKIVSELENGKLSLDETIKKYEEGMKLSKKCNDILDNAEKKITIISKDLSGNYVEDNFEAEE